MAANPTIIATTGANTNSDTSSLVSPPQDILTHILYQLRIMTILLREGMNLPDEDSSLFQQPQPLLNPTIVVTTVP